MPSSGKICRTCLENKGKLRPFFVTSKRLQVSLPEMMKSFSSIQTSADDGLPRWICINCLRRLENAYKFKVVCESSNFYLRECLKKDVEESIAPVKDKPPETKAKLSKTNSYSIANLMTEFKSTGDSSGQEKDKKRRKRSSQEIRESQKCFKCGKSFQYYGYLAAHMRTHTGIKPYECSICKKRFAQAGNLQLHLRTHSRERRYQCEICSKLFTTSSNLYAHQRTHSVDRNFICDVCQKAFKSAGELASHAGTHSGVKNHICKVCNKAFYKTSYLNLHVKTVHVGEKRHRCSECGKEFSSSSNLTCHFRIHTGEKPFSCKFCGDRFNQSSALIRHTRQHTAGKKIPPSGESVNKISGSAQKPERVSASEETLPVASIETISSQIHQISAPTATYSSYYLKIHEPQDPPTGIILCDPNPESTYEYAKSSTIDYIKTYATYPYSHLSQ
ncbi:zinc finger protein 782-like [Sergentomyia squamirostris]